jgi:biliverdin reductase
LLIAFLNRSKKLVLIEGSDYYKLMDNILKVGIVGTGYAAEKRAEAVQNDSRVELVAITGNSPERIASFCQKFGVTAIDSWQRIVDRPDLDIIIICTINRDHGIIARAAIEAGKHVIIEYPLALDPKEAAAIINLAKTKEKLLHVEHIEILGGVHQTIKKHLPDIGNIFYARYTTIAPQRPAPRRWSYDREMFGFPFSAALSRINRLTDLFGEVAEVSCQTRFWDVGDTGYFSSCLCNAQLHFCNEIMAEVSYGKGEVFCQSEREFLIRGDEGILIFQGEKGTLIKGEEKIDLEVGSRRGLFDKDTRLFLDRLQTGTPLYITPEESYYALKVADAARISSLQGRTIELENSK